MDVGVRGQHAGQVGAPQRGTIHQHERGQQSNSSRQPPAVQSLIRHIYDTKHMMSCAVQMQRSAHTDLQMMTGCQHGVTQAHSLACEAQMMDSRITHIIRDMMDKR